MARRGSLPPSWCVPLRMRCTHRMGRAARPCRALPKVHGKAGFLKRPGRVLLTWRGWMRQSLRAAPKGPCTASLRGAGLTASAARCGWNRPQAVEGRADAVQADGVQELARLLERVGGGNASAAELYQLQFLVGMLRVQATGGAKLSQQVNQGFESLLKQQG